MFSIGKKTNKKGVLSGIHLSLEEQRCLYLDEIIDAKILKETDKVLLCSNNDSLKLMDLTSGNTQHFQGHTDIILCVDVH